MLTRQFRLLGVAAAMAVLLLVYFQRSESYDYRPVEVPKDWLHNQGSEKFVHRPYANAEPKKIPVAVAEGYVDDEDTATPQAGEVYYLYSTSASGTPAATPTSIPDQATATSGTNNVATATELMTLLPASTPIDDADVDWSRFAYAQYVTDGDYLCNSVMIFEALHRLGAKAERIMMYPYWMLKDPVDGQAGTPTAKLLVKARDEYDVKLIPIHVQRRDTQDGQDATWSDSYTKLLAFNQTQYDRVLSLDSDATVLAPVDELFLLPKCKVAMPRAYWLLDEDPPKKVFSTQLMLLQPDADEFSRVQERVKKAGENEYDMEIVNQMYNDTARVIPHRPYGLLSGEFRGSDDSHQAYLGSSKETWDPEAVYAEAKLVHFSDWPVPKPWVEDVEGTRHDSQPECVEIGDGRKNCSGREVWNELYEDFAQRRSAICGLSLSPMYK